MATAIWFLIRRYINEPEVSLPQGDEPVANGRVLDTARQRLRSKVDDQKIPKAIPVDE